MKNLEVQSPSFRLCAGIFLLTFAVFHGSLDNEFVNWDDPMFIYENSRIQVFDRAHVWELFTSFEAGAYTPLSQLSLTVDHAIGGLNPAGYHLTALLLHALNACLVFLIARRLIQRPDSDTQSSVVGALLAALFFAIHPMRVESVAWASERRDVLSGFFGLGCVLAYIRYAQSPGGQQSRAGTQSFILSPWSPLRWYAISFFLFVCAVISKPMAVTLPVVFLLMDACPLGRLPFSWKPADRRQWMGALAEKLPFFGISLLAGLAVINTLLLTGLAAGTRQTGWESRAAQALVANMLYLWKMLLPLNLNPLEKLSVAFHFDQPVVWVGTIVNLAITIVLILFHRRFPGALIAWFAWLVIIFPVLGVAASGLQLTADRYTYLAGIPWCVFLGGVFEEFRNRRRAQLLPAFAALAVLGWFAWLTHQQIGVWKNSETLWVHCLRMNPRNGVAWNNLGETASAEGRKAEAIHHYREAVRFDPGRVEAWCNLGAELNDSGRHSEAIEVCRQALRCDPVCAQAHGNLGGAYAHLNNLTAALRHYQAARILAPSPVAEYNLGWCLALKGDTESALKRLRPAAEQGVANAWILWSELLARGGETEAAISTLKEGAERTGQAHVQLALVETILSRQHPSAADLILARKILLELRRKTGGNSEKVRKLMARLREREAPQKSSSKN